jgi:hypothetical protein
MEQNNFNNFNGNDATTFEEFGFRYSAPESVQVERNTNFTTLTEDFVNNRHRNVTTTTSTTSSVEQTNFDENLIISPPFPPNIEPKVLALELINKGGKRTKKMLNEFFLFRKEFVRELKRQNLHPRQTKVSALASTAWHKQKPSVKDEYRRLAREVERLFMIERQQVDIRTESNESSTDDSVSSPTEPTEPTDFQIPLSNLSPNNITILEPNTQNNVRRNYVQPNYPEYHLPWAYNHYDRRYVRPNVTPVTTSYRHFTNYFHPYDDQVVVPSQDSQEYFTPDYSR